MTYEERLARAKEYADEHGTEVEEWMVWEGWKLHIGCEDCNEGGPSAHCWGYIGCHGYYKGCGCEDCAREDELN